MQRAKEGNASCWKTDRRIVDLIRRFVWFRRSTLQFLQAGDLVLQFRKSTFLSDRMAVKPKGTIALPEPLAGVQITSYIPRVDSLLRGANLVALEASTACIS